MRLVQALVAECQLCSYFVQLHRIHYKRRTLNLQIKHRQCWFNNFESTCSLLNCRLQFLCPSCISLMFKQHPSITFFCQHPSTYFWQHPSKYLDVGRRPSNWWALHRQKPMQLKMRWTSSLSKLTTGSPRMTSHQNWPLTKVDLSPKMTSFHCRWPRGSVRGCKTSTYGSLSWRRYSSWSWSWRDNFLMILALRLLET